MQNFLIDFIYWLPLMQKVPERKRKLQHRWQWYTQHRRWIYEYDATYTTEVRKRTWMQWEKMKRPFKTTINLVIRSECSGPFLRFQFCGFGHWLFLSSFLLLDYFHDEHVTRNIHHARIHSFENEWNHSTKQNTLFNGLHSLPVERRAINFTDACV